MSMRRPRAAPREWPPVELRPPARERPAHSGPAAWSRVRRRNRQPKAARAGVAPAEVVAVDSHPSLPQARAPRTSGAVRGRTRPSAARRPRIPQARTRSRPPGSPLGRWSAPGWVDWLRPAADRRDPTGRLMRASRSPRAAPRARPVRRRPAAGCLVGPGRRPTRRARHRRTARAPGRGGPRPTEGPSTATGPEPAPARRLGSALGIPGHGARSPHCRRSRRPAGLDGPRAPATRRP